MIIRTIRNKENPWVQINREALNDSRLSLKARGLWATCLSKPDNWHFHVSALVKELKEGKTAIYSALNELIEAGYCIRGQQREVEGGQFKSVEYIIYEFPATEEDKKMLDEMYFQKNSPQSGFPQAENPHTENQPLHMTYSQKQDIDKKHMKGDAENALFSSEKDEMGNPEYKPRIVGKLKEQYERLSFEQKHAFQLLVNVPPCSDADQRVNPVTAVNIAFNTPLEKIRKAVRFYQQKLKEGIKPQNTGALIIKFLNDGLEPMGIDAEPNKSFWNKHKHHFPEGSYQEHQRYIHIPRIDGELSFAMSHEIFVDQFKRLLKRYKEE